MSPVLSDLLLRAETAVRAEQPFAALSTLRELTDRLRSPARVAPVLAVLDSLPEGFQEVAIRRVRSRLERRMK